MSKWIVVSLVCLICLGFLANGALPPEVRTSEPAAPEAFVADPSLTFPGATDERIDGAQLLDRALAALRDVAWLRLTVWQRLHHAEHRYEATTRLSLGPDHCARLETSLQTHAATCRRQVISDGESLAEIFSHADDTDKLTSYLLPDRAKAGARDQFLRDKGCVGPLPILTELRAIVPAWKTQTGAWRQTRVLRLAGTIDRQHPKVKSRPTFVANSCHLYLDAQTLWPRRLEWWTGHDASQRLHLEIEYREPQINRPLTRAECTQAFTYQP